jgi:alcohol dehydrogenase class IV
MDAFTWNEPTRLVFGAGSVSKAGLELTALGAKRAFIVTGKGPTASSAGLARLRSSLEASGIEAILYARVGHDPDLAAVEEAARALLDSATDCILAYGGGSPIDCAKSAALYAANVLASGAPARGASVLDFVEGRRKYELPGLPLIALPSTAGSGSEMSGTAVITAGERKIGLSGPLFFPRLALVDPELQASMPGALTAATGMDALTHAVESYASKRSTPLTRAIAAGAVRLILASLGRAYDEPENLEARSAMAEASSIVAIAFSQTGLGMVHGFAHPVGARAGLAHGLANAIMLPRIMEACAETAPQPYATLAREVGLAVPVCDGAGDAEAAGVLVSAVEALRAKLGIPASLSEAGVPVSTLSGILADAQSYRNRASSPRAFSDEELEALLDSMY